MDWLGSVKRTGNLQSSVPFNQGRSRLVKAQAPPCRAFIVKTHNSQRATSQCIYRSGLQATMPVDLERRTTKRFEQNVKV